MAFVSLVTAVTTPTLLPDKDGHKNSAYYKQGCICTILFHLHHSLQSRFDFFKDLRADLPKITQQIDCNSDCELTGLQSYLFLFLGII